MSNQKDFNLTWEEYFLSEIYDIICDKKEGAKELIMKHAINMPLKYIEKIIEIEWDWVCWEKISNNKYITFDFLKKHKDKKWNLFVLSVHKNISLENIFEPKPPKKQLEWWKYEEEKEFDWPQCWLNQRTDLVPNLKNISVEYGQYSIEIKRTNGMYRMGLRHCFSSYHNIPIKFIKQNPDFDWNWDLVSEHPDVDIEIVKKNIGKDWDWRNLSSRIKLKDIEENLDLPWDWYDISGRQDITYDFAIKTMHNNSYKVYTKDILNKSIDILRNNIGLWDWGDLTINKPIKDIEENLDLPWFWPWVSDNIEFTFDLVKKYKYKNWNWYDLSQHKNITIKDIEENLDLPWEWDNITYNPNITIEFIKKHNDKDWNWYDLSSHKNITIKDIEENLDLPWNWNGISCNPNINIRFIEIYINEKWNWNALSKHKNITIKDIEENLDLPWKWGYVSENPNITFDFIKRNLNLEWWYDSIGRNSFDGEKEKFERDKKNYILQNCFPEYIPFEVRSLIMDLV